MQNAYEHGLPLQARSNSIGEGSKSLRYPAGDGTLLKNHMSQQSLPEYQQSLNNQYNERSNNGVEGSLQTSFKRSSQLALAGSAQMAKEISPLKSSLTPNVSGPTLLQ